MSRIRRSDDSGSKFIGFRLDRDTAEFYSKQAKASGSTLSEFLRNMIVQGMIAESAYEVELRLRGGARQGRCRPFHAANSCFS